VGVVVGKVVVVVVDIFGAAALQPHKAERNPHTRELRCVGASFLV
jgi:hypothetical protein